MHMFEWCITRTSSCELYMCLANNWPCIFECMDLFVPMYEWDGSGQVPVHFVCVVQITVLVSLQLECSNKRTALCTMYSNTPLAHTLLHPTFCHRTTHQGEHTALLPNCGLSLSLSGGGGCPHEKVYCVFLHHVDMTADPDVWQLTTRYRRMYVCPLTMLKYLGV